jgi:hypothetical protein
MRNRMIKWEGEQSEEAHTNTDELLAGGLRRDKRKVLVNQGTKANGRWEDAGGTFTRALDT